MHLTFDKRLVETKKAESDVNSLPAFLPSNAAYTSPAVRAASNARLNRSRAVVRSPASQAASALLNRLNIGSAMVRKVGFGSMRARAAASDLLKSSWASAIASSTQSANARKAYAGTFIQISVAS